MGSLKDLQKHRKDILLAEVAAWLHDVGKLHLGHQAKWLKNKNRSFYNHTRFGPGKAEKFLYSFFMLLLSNFVIFSDNVVENMIGLVISERNWDEIPACPPMRFSFSLYFFINGFVFSSRFISIS